MERKTRNYGIDVLKIIATLFVVVLHINGFVYDTFVEMKPSVDFLWHLLEAIAYPAIHIFVMITSWFALEKIKVIKSILTVWIQTLVICILGVVIAVCLKIPIGVKELFSSFFPFVGRAYWYVTDYILLIILAPVLNIIIAELTSKKLIALTGTLFISFSMFPWLFTSFGWNQDYSNIALFILLYFLTAVVKNNIQYISKKLVCGSWIFSIIILLGSYETLSLLTRYVHPVFGNKTMYFYQYNSPFVILEAMSIFIVFFKSEIYFTRKWIIKIIRLMVNASLCVYLIHMHPIFKEKYVSFGFFTWINVKNVWIYLA